MLRQVRRWLPHRAIYVVADSSFATFEFLSSLAQMSQPVHVVTRLRLDAELWQPAPPRKPKQMGRPRIIGQRLPTLKAILNALANNCASRLVWQGQLHFTHYF